MESRRTEREEHLVFCEELGGAYIGHSTLDSGNSASVAKNVLDLIRETKCEESIIALLVDGTNVNTGWRNGALVQIERELQTSLQWLVCQLHANELPLRLVR